MLAAPVKPFVQPQSVYRLEYPAHWDQVIEKEGISCGFGPHDRDDVGLWISILPFSVDTERLEAELPKAFAQALAESEAVNPRPDPTLRHYGLIADMTKEGEGGHYWILAGGDVVLFASTQVPVAERDEWNPPFAKMMASLQITREKELVMRKLANDVLARLRDRYPDQEFKFDEGNKIRGKQQVVYLSNLYREVQASPARREKIIDGFINALNRPEMAHFGHETWEDAKAVTIPVLKPRAYIAKEGPTQHMLTQEWLADVLICYAIRSKKTYRFVTGWDVDRWETTPEALHEAALANLVALPWPRELVGARTKDGGRIMVVQTDDGMSSSRLLHPELHRMFSGPLGSPFWAGIPCRDTLVLYSDRRALKQRTVRRLRKDHDASAYPITPMPFLVTRDGIAPSDEE
jgi:uncharacterized protein YtpQ (UPF0354 family)